MTEHVDTETVSAFRENLLPEHQAARVAAHLSSCARCADVDAQLAGVSALLASSPVPPMPATLTARIEAALAAEAAIRSAPAHPAPAHPAAGPATRPAGAGPAGAGPDGPAGTAGSREAGGARRRRRRPSAWSPGFSRLALRVSAVAATIIVLAGAGYGLAQLAASSQSGSSASSASAPKRASGNRALLPSGSGQPGPALASGLPLVASGTNYQPGQIEAQASAVLRRHLSFRANIPAGTAGTHASAFGGLNNVRACVTRVTGGLRPRVVDVASYRGQPALAIIVPAGGGSMRVWVVGTGCSAAASDMLAQASIPGGG